MDRIYIFDVDGTLTPSRLPMTQDFSIFFSLWSMDNPFYLVTGSDIDKTKEQVPWYILERAQAVFTCCGNEMWRDDELIYDNKFKVTKKLNKLLGTILSNSIYPHRYGNHIEDRGSMVNFSIVGRDCTQEQRDEYFKYDNEKGERKIIANVIKEKFPDLDAVIGGQISIDIYPKGNDKSQILDIIEQERLVQPDEYIFIGDGIDNKGNDYPLAKLMEETNNCKYFQTEGPEQTMEILQWLQIDGETK